MLEMCEAGPREPRELRDAAFQQFEAHGLTDSFYRRTTTGMVTTGLLKTIGVTNGTQYSLTPQGECVLATLREAPNKA